MTRKAEKTNGYPPACVVLAAGVLLGLSMPSQAAGDPRFALPDFGGWLNPLGLANVGIQSAPVFVDLDADGDLDVLAGNIQGDLMYFVNAGTDTAPAFDEFDLNPFGLDDVGTASIPSVADLDADGDLDVFVGDSLGNTHYFENTGSAAAPVFADAIINPFGLTDVGDDSAPAFADIDGDGDLDAFIGESFGDTFYFENTGTASLPAFAAPVVNPFGLQDIDAWSTPFFADIDDDGDLDALIGSSNGDTNYFENTGTAAPVFAAPLTDAFGLSSVSDRGVPAFADLDGDGDLDVLFGEEPGNLIFFANTGTAADAQFDMPAKNPFSGDDFGVKSTPDFADIDGDGDLDAFVGNLAGETFYSENFGSAQAPVFGNPVINSFGLTDVGGLSVPSFADLDGDGDLDAFIGESLGNIFHFENTGTASAPAFAAPVVNPFDLQDVGGSSAPDFADLDGDGDLDALIGSSNGDTHYFENTGMATAPLFAAPLTNAFGLSNVDNLSQPTFADLDDDGDMDVHIGTLRGNTVFFENTGTATAPVFAAPVTNPFGLGPADSASAPVFADLNADGDLDIVIGNDNGYLTTVSNRPAAPLINPFGLADVGERSAPALADIDADGDFDVFAGTLAGDVLHFENTGNDIAPAFAAAVTNPFGLTNAGTRSAPAFADLDGDGDLDAYLGEADGNTLFFENTGSAAAPSFATSVSNPFGLSDVGENSMPAFSDLDGDGDLDAFIGETLGDTVYFENTGTATAPAFAAQVSNPFGLVGVGLNAAPGFADLDGDGDLDVLVGARDGNTHFFKNNGTPSGPAFDAVRVSPFGLTDVGWFSVPAFADLDGDGDLDALIGRQNGELLYDENIAIIGSGTDSDGDGLPDDYELANGLDANDDGSSNVDNGPDGDPDADGVSNIDEFNAGTAANDPDSDSDGLGDAIDADPANDSNACLPDGNGDAEFDFAAMAGLVTQCAADNSITVLDAANAVIEPGATLHLYSLSVLFAEGAAVPLGAQVQTIIGNPRPGMAP